MTRATLAAQRGRPHVDEVLELVICDERTPPRARDELVGAADELVSAFALTLVASQQTQRT